MVLIVAYLLAVHALLAVALVKTDLVPRIVANILPVAAAPPQEAFSITWLRGFQAQMDPQVPARATLFLGDSITMALATAAVAPYGVNYGIGGQRSDQLLGGLDLYDSLHRASAVVVTVGTNDLLQGRDAGIAERYRAILARIPGQSRIVMSSVPPLGAAAFPNQELPTARIRAMVAAARTACAADTRCRFVDAYALLTDRDTAAPGVLLADGIHLAPPGYTRWIDALRTALGEPRAPAPR